MTNEEFFRDLQNDFFKDKEECNFKAFSIEIEVVGDMGVSKSKSTNNYGKIIFTKGKELISLNIDYEKGQSKYVDFTIHDSDFFYNTKKWYDMYGNPHNNIIIKSKEKNKKGYYIKIEVSEITQIE